MLYLITPQSKYCQKVHREGEEFALINHVVLSLLRSKECTFLLSLQNPGKNDVSREPYDYQKRRVPQFPLLLLHLLCSVIFQLSPCSGAIFYVFFCFETSLNVLHSSHLQSTLHSCSARSPRFLVVHYPLPSAPPRILFD